MKSNNEIYLLQKFHYIGGVMKKGQSHGLFHMTNPAFKNAAYKPKTEISAIFETGWLLFILNLLHYCFCMSQRQQLEK